MSNPKVWKEYLRLDRLANDAQPGDDVPASRTRDMLRTYSGHPPLTLATMLCEMRVST